MSRTISLLLSLLGWMAGAAVWLVAAVAPSSAQGPPSCGWVASVQEWSGGLSWNWSHHAQWLLIPNTEMKARVQDAGSGTYHLTGSPFVGFSGDVDGQLGFDDYLQRTDSQNNVFFERTELSGPIVGPVPGNKTQMLLLLDSTACTYTWQMTAFGEGTYSTESFSEATDGQPNQIHPGTHPIPELPGPLSFSGSVAATNNPQVPGVEPQYAFNAHAAFASVGRAPFQPASVSWTFVPGQATAPFNDTCAGATFLLGSEQQDTSFATTDPSDPAPSCGGGDRSVWFFFFASTDGTAEISTAGSGYTTVVSVSPMTQSCGALAREIACGIDGASVPVQANTAYRVQVRRSGSGGTGALRAAVSVPEPAAACAAAVAALAALAQMRRSRPRQ